MPKLRVIGPPGTGKTTFLQRQVAAWVERGVEPDEIVISSLTRAAASVVRGRIDLPPGNAATIHALAYRGLGHPSIAEVGALAKQWGEQPDLPASWRLRLSQDAIDEGVIQEQGSGTALAEYSRLRSMGRSDWGELDDFVAAWEDFKGQTHSMDFADLIDIALLDCPTAPGNPRCFVVDERQDSTAAMVRLADSWGAAAEYYLEAGDPAQTLYQWAGADWRSMLTPLPAGQERRLGRSYRMPSAVHEYAEDWLQRHTEPMTTARSYAPREAEGAVSYAGTTWMDGDGLLGTVAGLLEGDGEVMVLASCAYMLEPTIAALRNAGVPYHNEYRRSNGRWNPLNEREGTVSTLHRLRMWLSDVWSDDGARAWLELLPARWFRGTKKAALEALEGQRGLTIQQLAPVLHDAALNAQAAQDGGWLVEQAAARFKGPLGYAWRLWQHDHEALGRRPRVTVGTINSVKGGEAAHVVLVPDLSPAGVAERWTEDGADATVRLWYVGLSRASETVTICAAASERMSVYA